MSNLNSGPRSGNPNNILEALVLFKSTNTQNQFFFLLFLPNLFKIGMINGIRNYYNFFRIYSKVFYYQVGFITRYAYYFICTFKS